MSVKERRGNAEIEMPAIEHAVKEILGDVLLQDEYQLTPQARLAEDLGMDSLDRVELAMRIEEGLLDDRQMGEDTVEAWVTVQDVVDTVKRIATK